ncbi:transglycosylase domain-containing protein [Roseibacillus ishigakijimensis]|uniref:Transglycosylase domain-containing protein n=1 Tax=Roseibacillus ishigakijimensis TaxID=454146 RepID=A0A934VLF1_9BACT|nr:transglycosylase domain-containing protein [Roseibacillus ishigakijimensis]MBK1834619.1 transglycosylase domain-containing protein [Roseibacillus ishigakijimensis]
MAKKKANRRRPAKKKATRQPASPGFFGWLFFWPYHLLARLVASWPAAIRWPVKLGAFGAAMGFVCALVMALFYAVRALPYDLAEVREMPERTTVLDRNGREIARLHGENRTIVPLSEISPHFENALLAREDSRFRRHPGVDPFGIARSILENIKRRRFAQGSSTLTMQLARNTFNLQNGTLLRLKTPGALVELDRKFLEIAVSFRIEARYSKDEILEAYVNRIFWGHSYRGIEAAAQNYFGKPAADLTLSECALLAGIIRGPNSFTPHRYPERAKRERDTTLDSMVRENFLSPQEAEKAKQEPLRIKETPQVKTGWSLNIIQRELNEILARKNIKQGGLTITTTLDASLQSIAEDAVEEQLRTIESRAGYPHRSRASWQRNPGTTPDYLQAAVVILDTKTGAVRTVVGGRDVSESAYDRAQWSQRSAGSLFKPFVYLAAYEKGMLPETWVADTPLRAGEVKNAAAGWPANADGKYYERIRSGDGLILSRNASTIRVGDFAGMEEVVDTARAAGLLRKADEDPSLYLGNFPASPWELATAYTTFPNGGSRVVPYLIDRIQDDEGKVLYQSSSLKAPVARPETAGLVNNLLREVTASGTARSLRSVYGFSAPAAGKTGTTNDYHDAWYAGYTSSLTACVWVGLDSPKTIVDSGYGGSLALPIWADIFRKAASLREIDGSSRYPANSLDPELEYERVRLCRHSGKRVTPGCEAAGTAYQDLVPRALVPAHNDFCTVHPLRALPVPSQSAPPRRQQQQPLRALPVE